MKPTLLAINHVYILFISSIYVGLFWSLHFFFFPSFRTVTLENYYAQMVPPAVAATQFFFVVIPPMMAAIGVMIYHEWRTRFRWVALAWIPGLLLPVLIQQGPIEDVNDQFKQGVTDSALLAELLEKWMMLNDLRGVILTAMWAITVYYFVAKNDLRSVLVRRT